MERTKIDPNLGWLNQLIHKIGMVDELASSWPTEEVENGGVVVNVDNLPSSADAYTVVISLLDCERYWRSQKKKVIWLKLPSTYYDKLLSPAYVVGFSIHRTEPTYAMLFLRFEEDEPSALPANASNQVGAGPCVIPSATLQQVIIDPDWCTSTPGQSHGSLVPAGMGIEDSNTEAVGSAVEPLRHLRTRRKSNPVEKRSLLEKKLHYLQNVKKCKRPGGWASFVSESFLSEGSYIEHENCRDLSDTLRKQFITIEPFARDGQFWEQSENDRGMACGNMNIAQIFDRKTYEVMHEILKLEANPKQMTRDRQVFPSVGDPVGFYPLEDLDEEDVPGDGTNEHRSQAKYDIEVNVDTKLKGEPAQAIMGDSAASLESQAEVPSSRSLPFVDLQEVGGMAGKRIFSNLVERAILKKHDEEDGDVKNEVSAIVNAECGIEAMEEQMYADLPSSADSGELLCDESDSETEESGIPSEDEGWSGESAASIESQAEVTSDINHVPQTEPSRKRSAASAFGEDDDLIATIGSFVNKQIEVALMCALQSRAEDEQRHREKMQAIENEKWALIRQKMAQWNAVRAWLRKNLDNLKLLGAPQFVVRECSQDSKAPADDLSYLHIPFSAIELGDPIKALPATLNKGDAHLEGQALVHNGRWNGCDYAIKVFKSSALHWNTEELQKELASLVKLRHPHIIQLIGCAQNEERTYVLYEKMDCDLRELIDGHIEKSQSILGSFNRRPFSHAVEIDTITQIAKGMLYLHEMGYVHGDLMCSNVLVKQVGGHIDVKVSDFHCSRELGQTPRNAMYKPNMHRERWMAPEVFGHYDVEQPADEVLEQHNGSTHGIVVANFGTRKRTYCNADVVLKKADVYSFGMVCYEILTGCKPFDGIRGDAVVKEKILAGDRPTLPVHTRDDLKKLIQNCWAANPEDRPSFKKITHALGKLKTHYAQSLSACFGFGNPSVPDEPEDEEWSFKDEMGSGTDDAAKDLPHYLQIDPANLKPIRKLGKDVFVASWMGGKVTVKWLKSDHLSTLRHEVGIMMTLLHPHVVRLVGFSGMARANRCAIVMELMESSLREFMDEKMKSTPKPFSEAEAVQIISKLALGMDFLHSRGVAHRDLKCSNIMVRNTKADAPSAHPLVVKLADFGLSHSESRIESKPSVGFWRAPEVIVSMESTKPVPYDPMRADVYSFGILCYEIITGKVPYHDVHPSLAKELVKIGIPPKLDSINVGKALEDLLKECWCLAPQNRPTFSTLCKRLAAMCKSVHHTVQCRDHFRQHSG